MPKGTPKKERPKIHTTSYVMGRDGNWIRFDDLDQETKEKAGMALLCRYCNELYRGKAIFTPPEHLKLEHGGFK